MPLLTQTARRHWHPVRWAGSTCNPEALTRPRNAADAARGVPPRITHLGMATGPASVSSFTLRVKLRPEGYGSAFLRPEATGALLDPPRSFRIASRRKHIGIRWFWPGYPP